MPAEARTGLLGAAPVTNFVRFEVGIAYLNEMRLTG